MIIPNKKVLYISLIAVSAILISPPLKNIARKHVDVKTGVTDHPLLCTSCHLYITDNKLIRSIINAKYISPFNLAVATDGKTLYAISQDRDQLLVVDINSGMIRKKIRVGTHPHSVILDKAGKKAYVSNQWSDYISVIDLGTVRVTDTLSTANGPAGMSLSLDSRSLYVVNSYSSDISVINITTGDEQNRLKAGNNPTGSCISPDGSKIFITSRRAEIEPYGSRLRSELTIINDSSHLISERLNIESAYLIENIDFTPDGSLALFTLVRPKNLVPSIQVEQGFMMNHGFGVVDLKSLEIYQFLLDEPNAYYADPFDVVVSKDGKYAFISSSGVDCISVISIDSIKKFIYGSSRFLAKEWANNLALSGRYVIKRIRTGANPKGMALSPDGKFLYVAEFLEDKISVINTSALAVVNAICLDGPPGITVARKGRQLMNNAGHTFQNQYSCYTCHPDGHEDGLVYNMASRDMGRNITNTQSLRDIAKTAPFKWNGKNQTVYKQDGIRFSTVLSRTEPFSYKELDAITAYILTGIPYPPNLQYNATGKLSDLQERGKIIFERTMDNKGRTIPVNNRCITCHPPPYFTNCLPADVNTLGTNDDSMLFDTPHLNNIYASPPYLHDGRASTLEEIWTIYGNTDRHGFVSDLTKSELNELIEYLKSLRSPDYENNQSN